MKWLAVPKLPGNLPGLQFEHSANHGSQGVAQHYALQLFSSNHWEPPGDFRSRKACFPAWFAAILELEHGGPNHSEATSPPQTREMTKAMKAGLRG